MNDPMSISNSPMHGSAEVAFRTELADLWCPKVLELGTMRSNPSFPTHHAEWLPEGTTHVMSDAFEGLDVDIVADAHDLAPFGDEEFDAVIAVSVWEHLERPWVAAEAVHRVLKKGGLVYIATHQTFPIHGYPSDYFRFSVEAMNVLFGGPKFTNFQGNYMFPCKIIPPPEVARWNPGAPSFLNVECFSKKA